MTPDATEDIVEFLWAESPTLQGQSKKLAPVLQD